MKKGLSAGLAAITVVTGSLLMGVDAQQAHAASTTTMTIFEDANYCGWSKSGTGSNNYTNTGWLDSNEVSSFKVTAYGQYILCDGADLTGTCWSWVTSSNVPNVGSAANDKADSFGYKVL